MGLFGPDIQAQEILRDIQKPTKSTNSATSGLKGQGKKTGTSPKGLKKSKATQAKELKALRAKQKARAAKLKEKKDET